MVFFWVLSPLFGCVVNGELYQELRDPLEDHDGDGYSSALGDCDDDDPERSPGAGEVWYDGVDQDCAGDDDYDQDGDGDSSDQHGGGDCDDEDPTVSSVGVEGWEDFGLDNDCDDSTADGVQVPLSELTTPLAGDAEGDALGSMIRVIPGGWIDDEAIVLVSAPFAGQGGVVYGWPSPDLLTAAAIGDAQLILSASQDDTYLGLGLGWAGDEYGPLTLIGAEGLGGGTGEVEGWRPGDWQDGPSLTLLGSTPAGYLGYSVLAGYDADGDGVKDLLASSPLDSAYAAGAGTAHLLLDPASYDGTLALDDVDAHFVTSYAGAFLLPMEAGDLDGDGMDDLAFKQDISGDVGPGAFLITGPPAAGTHELEEVASANVIGGPMLFGAALDEDVDGVSELYGASGGLYCFELPLTGTVTPWLDAIGDLPFADSADTIAHIRTDVSLEVTQNRVLISSRTFQNQAGMISFEFAFWSDGSNLDEGQIMALGDRPGDQAGDGVELADLDGDGRTDVLVGAPGADSGGAGSGALYVVPAPR